MGIQMSSDQSVPFLTQDKFSRVVLNTIATGIVGAFCWMCWDFVHTNRQDIKDLEADSKAMHAEIDASVSAFKEEIAKLSVQLTLQDDSLRRAWSRVAELETGSSLFLPKSQPQSSPSPSGSMPEPGSALKQYEDSKSKLDWTIEQKKRAN